MANGIRNLALPKGTKMKGDGADMGLESVIGVRDREYCACAAYDDSSSRSRSERVSD